MIHHMFKFHLLSGSWSAGQGYEPTNTAYVHPPKYFKGGVTAKEGGRGVL